MKYKVLVFILVGLTIVGTVIAHSLNADSSIRKDELIEKYVEIWKADSCGCDGKRTIEMGNEIIRHYKLRDTPIDSVTKYLGKHSEAVIYYYIETSCNETKELLDSTKSVICLQLKFDRDGLYSAVTMERSYPIFVYSPTFETL